jgi:hypothetical protein
MFEPLVISAAVAAVVSTAVSYLHVWSLRVRLRRLEMGLAEWEERLVKEVKQRAAAASVAARASRLNPLDEALIRQHTGGNAETEEAPWWDKLAR